MLISRLFSLLFYRPQKRFMHFHLTISTEMVFTFFISSSLYYSPVYLCPSLHILFFDSDKRGGAT